MPGAGLADGMPLVLEELESPYTAVVLEGSALPEQGRFETGVELRRVTTWYPGAAAASVQVLGTRERAIPLSGWLRDTWLGAAGAAAEARAALEQLCRGGRYCQLTWGSLVVARGFVAEATFAHESETALQYTLSFEVTDADPARAVESAPFEPVAEAELFEVLDALSTALDTLDEATAALNVVQAFR